MRSAAVLAPRQAGTMGFLRGSRTVQEALMSDVLSKSRFSIYDAVTAKIVKAIEAGAGTYTMPWHSPGKPIGLPTNAATYSEYRAVNVLSLWIASLARDYPTGDLATYKQWRDLGAQVRKGEQGTLIVFYKQIEL